MKWRIKRKKKDRPVRSKHKMLTGQHFSTFILLKSITTRSVFRSSRWSQPDLHSIIINTDECPKSAYRFRVNCSSSSERQINCVWDVSDGLIWIGKWHRKFERFWRKTFRGSLTWTGETERLNQIYYHHLSQYNLYLCCLFPTSNLMSKPGFIR